MLLQIRVHHQVKTDHIIKINQMMSDFQRKKLERTLFKLLLQLQEPIDICSPLLQELQIFCEELVCKWVLYDENIRRDYVLAKLQHM